MARFIKSFSNDAAIQAAVDNKSLGKPYVALDENTGKIDWNGKEESYSKQYLTIQALESGNFSFEKTSYSVNGGAWVVPTSLKKTITLNSGDTVSFKSTESGKTRFQNNTLSFKVYGNIESLEYGDDFIGQTTIKYKTAFIRLFENCSGLKDASNLILPATTLKDNCYGSFAGYGMFTNCTSLIAAPQLAKAITIPRNAPYLYMFSGCISLEKAPDLLAETLDDYNGYGTYENMFRGCTSLNYVKCLATTFSTGSVENWLSGVSPTGTFVKKAGVTWPTGKNGIPSGWTVIEE